MLVTPPFTASSTTSTPCRRGLQELAPSAPILDSSRCCEAARRRRCDPMTTHGFFESGSEIGNRARSSSWWMPCSEALVVRAWRRLPMSSLGLYGKRPERSSRSQCSCIRSPIRFGLSCIFYPTETNPIGSKITRCTYPTKSKSNKILVPKSN